MIENLAIDIEEYSDIEDFKEYMSKYTIKLLVEFSKVIYKFYKVGWKSFENVSYLDTYPQYCTSSINYRYRFMIFKVEDDYVLVNLKVIDSMGRRERYFHIYKPISLNDVEDNVKRVFNLLKSSKHIKGYIDILKSDERLADSEYWCNSYYNTLESMKFMTKSAWKSKHCINRMKDLVSYQIIDYADPLLVQDIIEFSEKWEDIKSGESEKKSDVKLLELLRRRDDILLGVFRVNEVIVGFNILFLYFDRYAVVHTAKYLSVGTVEYLSEYLGVDMSEAKLVKYNLSAYIQYITHEEFLVNRGYEAFSYEGDTHLSWLKNYKEMFYKNRIYYIRKPIGEVEL